MAHVNFQLDGKPMSLSDDAVETAVRSETPEPARTHVVRINGKEYPVKQAFSAATGLDRLDFTTNQARRILKRLGFEVERTARGE